MPLHRRTFLTTAAMLPPLGLGVVYAAGDDRSEEFTAGSPPGPVFGGAPVVSGPAPESLCILQPLQRYATGWVEYSVNGGPLERAEAAEIGLRALDPYVLKVRLPPLPPGAVVRYRVTARSIGWVRVREFLHGEIRPGEPETGPEHEFRTLDPAAASTKFVVWNDTHENVETLKSLHEQTEAAAPDFLLWNGDQTNDLHFAKDMAGQLLAPAGLAISAGRPLAYVRGNHDVRGPEAGRVPQFTGTPGDRFYYAFRSGPLAALVMDTGEDKPDDNHYLGGLAAFQPLQRRQAAWLAQVVKEPWFASAPFKVLFCHIPLWFTRDIFPEHKRWEFHPVCRELWLPHLAAAGVKLVVSGHTHNFRWMPAGPNQPLGQLIGGGPLARDATIIQGEATSAVLKLRMTKLGGEVVAEVELKA